nr:PREDICTED: LOW QUALITY PROTEIN: apoptosis-inducing factor 3 [Anolis carolinensis]|eukprot:XP_016852441.1 PREDICTED: LOW QUALITY PROTEIN: apoptosis-inducing factor 3 [Anolis carolinensis]
MQRQKGDMAELGDTVVTQQVCRAEEMADGEMREVDVAGWPVVLVKEGTRFWAVGGRCPHAGGPLSKGYLSRGRLRCPWHGACFSVQTGDIEEFPTLDCLPAFKVSVDEGQVYVTAKLKDLERSRRLKLMSKRDPLDPRTVLLLGAGPASLTCAETLRQEGFSGRIIMVTQEGHLPYDRTKLSKDIGAQAEDILLRPPSFMETYGIEVWRQKEVVSINPDDKVAQFSDGTSQGYDNLLIATGSRPRLLGCSGCDLERSLHPADPGGRGPGSCAWPPGGRWPSSGDPSSVNGEGGQGGVRCKKSTVSSPAGMELASSLAGKASAIQVVERGHAPYHAVLGGQVGQVAMKMLQSQGVEFHLEAEVAELKGQEGKVTHVILGSGHKIPADVVVVGIGVVPNSAFLQGTPVVLDQTGSIQVDLFMKTNVPFVFAAGDVVSFPVALLGGKSIPIRHWQVAQAHGHVAALNILGQQKELQTVPFFWTRIQGKTIRYAGCGMGYTETVLKGSLEQERFLLFYLREGFVTAAASLNFDPAVASLAEVLLSRRRISKQEAE